MSKPGQRPAAQREAVRIVTVDLANRIAHVISKRDGRFKVGFRTVESLFQIPLKGETWIIERNSSWEWTLIKRQDRPSEHAIKTTLNQGDGHLRVPGTLRIDTGAGGVMLYVNGVLTPFGTHTHTESKNTTGPTTSWTLANTPDSLMTVELFNNGLLVDPTTLSLAGAVLTFGSVPTGHSLRVYYQTA